VHGVGLPAPQERAPGALDDRHLVAGEEPVDGGALPPDARVVTDDGRIA